MTRILSEFIDDFEPHTAPDWIVVVDKFAEIRDMVKRGEYQRLDRIIQKEEFYSILAGRVLATIKDSKDSLGWFAHLLMQKQIGYGSAPIRNWGALGVVIRIDSKIARYINLLGVDDQQLEESRIDTLWDIVGYCVLAILYLRETKGIAAA